MKLKHSLIPYTKINYKTLRGKHRPLSDINHSNIFSDLPPRAMMIKTKIGSSCCGSAETNLTSIHEDTDPIPALFSGLRIQHCCELWCRSQTWLGSGVAVAVALASSYSSNSTSSLGTSICHHCGPKKTKKKDKKNKETKINKWDLIKLEKFLHSKKTLNKMKRQPT